MTQPKKIKRTDLTRLRRAPKRGSFEVAQIHAILDATPICHVGYQFDGRTVVTPTCHWRVDDHVYWHGSRLSRTMATSEDQQVCLTVTHLDGLVLARSGFHHSANYRSAMVFGKPHRVTDRDTQLHLLERFVDGLFPGRWDMLRPPSRKEMNATTILGLPISEASAKVRSGPPVDLEEDLELPIWAGVIPVGVQVQAAVPCEHNQAGVMQPDHVSTFKLPGE